jgi:hypothetical protein
MDEIDLDADDIRCPKCNSDEYVRNGIVRNVQRYRCNSCRSNFSTDFKNRWPPSSKLINLILFVQGEPADTEGAPPWQTMDRWVSEAKEHHPWFIRALAENVVYGVEERGDTMRRAISTAMWIYRDITGRDVEVGGSFGIGDAMLADMVKLAKQPFIDELILFLESLPVPDQAR